MADENLEGKVRITLDEKPAVESIKKVADTLQNLDKKGSASVENLAKKLETRMTEAAARVTAAQKRLDAQMARSVGSVTRGQQDIDLQKEKTETKRVESEGRVLLTERQEQEKRYTAILRDGLIERRRLRQQERIDERRAEREDLAEKKRLHRNFVREFGPVSGSLQRDITTSFNRGNRMQQLNAASAYQMVPPSVIWQQQMNAAIARSNAAGAAAMIPGWGGPPGPPNRPPGGGGGGIFRRLAGLGGGGIAGSLISGLAGGFGVGIGGYALANAARGTVEAAQAATAYDRQQVAAERLAGSQEKLNSLMDAYTKASGGAVDQTTTLSNVSRLLATGYAEAVPEVERFIKATRGASLALGRPQDYVVQETQLAISNTSVKRLDQIGLGIEEVQTRIEELRTANSSMTREAAFQEAVLSLLEQKYSALADSAEGQATEVEKLGKSWRDLNLIFGQVAQGPLNAMAGLLNGMAEPLGKLAQANLDRMNRELRQVDSRRASSGYDELTSYLSGFNPFGPRLTPTQIRAQRVLDFGLLPNNTGSGYIGGPESSGRASAPWTRPEDQMQVLRDNYDATLELERNYSRQRLEETRQYEEQRASLIRNFGKQMVREEQDFARQRARSLEDYERAIVELMQDAQDREREWQEDLDERISDLREDSNERIQEIEEDYQKEREKAEKDHRDRLLKAAGQLDAIAVLEERKRWARENKEREEGHKEALEEQRENLQKQIDEANEAHQERLEDAREADEKRLQDMAADRERQLARENEDRAIRKARAEEDHAEQVAELDRQHEATMTRLAEEAEEQREALAQALLKDLDALGLYIEGYSNKMKKRDELIENWFESVIKRLEDEIMGRESSTYRYDPELGPQIPLHYQRGGPVPRTGPAILHAGEYVLSRDMLAAGFNPATGTTNSNRSVVVEAGAIAIYPAAGSEYLVGEMLEDKLADILERHYG